MFAMFVHCDVFVNSCQSILQNSNWDMPPYSRVTALHTCVYACWFGPDAHCKFLISALKYFTRIVCYCLTADAMIEPNGNVQWKFEHHA